MAHMGDHEPLPRCPPQRAEEGRPTSSARRRRLELRSRSTAPRWWAGAHRHEDAWSTKTPPVSMNPPTPFRNTPSLASVGAIFRNWEKGVWNFRKKNWGGVGSLGLEWLGKFGKKILWGVGGWAGGRRPRGSRGFGGSGPGWGRGGRFGVATCRLFCEWPFRVAWVSVFLGGPISFSGGGVGVDVGALGRSGLWTRGRGWVRVGGEGRRSPSVAAPLLLRGRWRKGRRPRHLRAASVGIPLLVPRAWAALFFWRRSPALEKRVPAGG